MVITVTTFFRSEDLEQQEEEDDDDVAISSVDTDNKSPTHNPGMISAQVGEGINCLNVILMMHYTGLTMSLPLDHRIVAFDCSYRSCS